MTTHNESSSTHVLIDLPGSSKVVGAFPRPPRTLTVGRRVSDRAVAWALVVFLLACSLFVLYVGWLATTTADLVQQHVSTACPIR